MGSFAIWGPSRSDLDRLAWSIAESVDPRFIWIEVTEGGAPPTSRELEVLEEIDLDRIERMDRAELLLTAHTTHGGSVAAGAGPTRTARLSPRLGARLDAIPAGPRPTAIVLANLDRTVALSHDGADYLTALAADADRRSLGLIATFGVHDAPPLEPFDCLVRVSAGPQGNIWNPTVDWTVRSSEPSAPLLAPPAGATAREVVHHLRSQRPRPL